MTAQSFSILNISLSIGNHLNAFSSRVFNRDISGSSLNHGAFVKIERIER